MSDSWARSLLGAGTIIDVINHRQKLAAELRLNHRIENILSLIGIVKKVTKTKDGNLRYELYNRVDASQVKGLFLTDTQEVVHMNAIYFIVRNGDDHKTLLAQWNTKNDTICNYIPPDEDYEWNYEYYGETNEAKKYQEGNKSTIIK